MPLRGGCDFLWAHHSGHVAFEAAGRGGGFGHVRYPMLTEGGGCWSVQGSAPAPPVPTTQRPHCIHTGSPLMRVPSRVLTWSRLGLP